MKIENFNFAGHKAIVRVDFNVPLDENGNVTDDTRAARAFTHPFGTFLPTVAANVCYFIFCHND
jgi:hypothetical protein